MIHYLLPWIEASKMVSAPPPPQSHARPWVPAMEKCTCQTAECRANHVFQTKEATNRGVKVKKSKAFKYWETQRSCGTCPSLWIQLSWLLLRAWSMTVLQGKKLSLGERRSLGILAFSLWNHLLSWSPKTLTWNVACPLTRETGNAISPGELHIGELSYGLLLLPFGQRILSVICFPSLAERPVSIDGMRGPHGQDVRLVSCPRMQRGKWVRVTGCASLCEKCNTKITNFPSRVWSQTPEQFLPSPSFSTGAP